MCMPDFILAHRQMECVEFLETYRGRHAVSTATPPAFSVSLMASISLAVRRARERQDRIVDDRDTDLPKTSGVPPG